MKIWIVHQQAIPPIVMGPTRHYDLAKKLIELGHEVHILAGNYCHNNFHYIAEPYKSTHKISYYAGVPFIWFHVKAYRKNSFARFWSMIKFAKEIITSRDIQYLPKPDLIIGSSPSPFAALAAQRLANKFKIPFIYEIRDLWPETLINLGSFSKYHPLIILLQAIENYLLRKADKILTVLPGVHEYLSKKNIPKNHICVLPNAVDVDQIQYTLPRTDTTLKISYAGAFNISNDVQTLLQAAKILNQKLPDKFQFQLIGEGPLKNHLQNYIVEEKISNVAFSPTVAKDKIYPVLSQADIFVGMVKKSNLYQYGTSLNKMTDYLACARPIVFALDSPYSPIQEANAGYTIEPENPIKLAEAIEKIARLTMEERAQLGLNGRKYAEKNYNINIVAQNLIDELNLVITKIG